jgi:TRAP-type transport system periplasmic protein
MSAHLEKKDCLEAIRVRTADCQLAHNLFVNHSLTLFSCSNSHFFDSGESVMQTRALAHAFPFKKGRPRTLLFIGVTITVLISGWLSASLSAPAQSSKTLKFGYILSLNSQLAAGGAVFADEIARRTNGRYKVEQYPNSALGGEVEMLKGVQLGTIDVAFITGAPLPNFLPEVGIFNIPFLFRDLTHAHSVLDGTIGQSYLEKFRAKNLVALAWGENGMRHITNSKHEIRIPEDLKGLKLRLPQSDVMLVGFKALGADVNPLPFPQLYGALQSGQFDGQENPIATIQSSKFNQVQKYLTLTSHVYDPAIIFLSVDIFEELSASDKKEFAEAAKLAGEASRKFAAVAEAKGVAELAQGGMQIVTNVDRTKFAAAMAVANQEFDRRFGSSLIDQIRQIK